MDEQAVQLAGGLVHGAQHKASIFVVYIIEVPREFPLDEPASGQIERAEGALAAMETLCEKRGWPAVTECLQARQAGPAVVNEAIERMADLVIMGMSPQRRYGEFTLGEAVPYVLEYAPCQVWILREPLA